MSLSSARAPADDITRDQLELLKAKFDVLQGERKAYFETYESTKRTNEVLVRELRERAKELRRQLGELPGVADFTVGGLSGRSADVALRYPGGGPALSEALAAQGVELRGSGGAWIARAAN